MRVSVQLFARLRELAGAGSLELDVPSGATIATVWEAMATDRPDLAPYRSAVSCALNEDFARMTTPVKDGDAVAFLPPVSGGDVDVSGREECEGREEA
jgi:molybdopterin converting factor subunit 1